MPTQLDQFDTTRRKANFAISIASALIACVVIIGTLLRLRMEGFQMVFPLYVDWFSPFDCPTDPNQ